jgi:hypothetical protein
MAQATELLNVVVILSKVGRLDDDSAAPSCYSESRFGDRGAAGSARLRVGLAGLGQRSLARHLVPGIAADTAAPIRGIKSHGRSLRLLGMSATCGGRLGEDVGDLGGRTAWAARKIVEYFRDAPTGLDRQMLCNRGKAITASMRRPGSLTRSSEHLPVPVQWCPLSSSLSCGSTVASGLT